VFFFSGRVLKHSVDCSSFCFSLMLSALNSVQTVFVAEFTNCEKKEFGFSYLSARPYLSVRMEQLGSHRADFLENCYLSIFRKSVEKIQILVKSVKNNRHLKGGPVIFIIMPY